MVKNIMRDPLFLSQKSEAATTEDLQIGGDLMDTFVRNSYMILSSTDASSSSYHNLSQPVKYLLYTVVLLQDIFSFLSAVMLFQRSYSI